MFSINRECTSVTSCSLSNVHVQAREAQKYNQNINRTWHTYNTHNSTYRCRSYLYGVHGASVGGLQPPPLLMDFKISRQIHAIFAQFDHFYERSQYFCERKRRFSTRFNLLSSYYYHFHSKISIFALVLIERST